LVPSGYGRALIPHMKPNHSKRGREREKKQQRRISEKEGHTGQIGWITQAKNTSTHNKQTHKYKEDERGN
jgi:hypothetical protein